MPVVRHTEARRTETPNAVMLTLASPSLGESETALWRVTMRAGQQGPDHTCTAEQIWTWLDGSATLLIDGTSVQVGSGDTVVIPATAARRITADTGFTAIVAAPASGRVFTATSGADPILPPWMA